MHLQIQIVRNSLYPLNKLHQPVPCIFIKTKNNLYIFNTPQLNHRYLHTNHLKLNRPINLFFTNNSITCFSGLHTLLIQLLERNRGNTTDIFFPPNIYQYYLQSWNRLGNRILKLSVAKMFCQENIGRFGFSCNKKYEEYIRSRKYWENKGNITNQQFLMLGSIEKQEIRNASMKIKMHQLGYKYFVNSDMTMYYFTIQSSTKKHYYNYICFPQGLAKLDEAKKNKYDLTNQQIKNLVKQKIQIKITHKNQQLTIKPHQIWQQQQYQTILLILNYSEISDLQQIQNNPIMQKYYYQLYKQIEYKNRHRIVIVHVIEGDGQIVKSKQFSDFIVRMGFKAKHIFQNPNLQEEKQLLSNKKNKNNNNTINFSNSFRLSTVLNNYCGNYLPNLCQIYLNYLQKYPRININKLALPSTIMLAKNLYEYINDIKNQLYRQIKSDRKLKIENPEKLIGLPNQQLIQLNNKQQQQQQDLYKQFNPKIIMLGTSSMISTFYRNVSGIMLQITNNDSILMDCGDGIFTQIINHFGQQSALQTVLKSIRIIFITHLHADHCTGILQLIQQRNKLLQNNKQQIQNNRLFLIIPSNMIEWVNAYQQHICKLSPYCQILFIETITGNKIQTQNNDTLKTKRFQNMHKSLFSNKRSRKQCGVFQKQKQEKEGQQQQQGQQDKQENSQQKQDQAFNSYKAIIDIYRVKQEQIHEQFKQYTAGKLNLDTFKPVAVKHCPQSYGIIIKHKNSLKISYSGDCQPTPKFQRQAHNSTLLIHQATYLNNERKFARMNKHSTVGEAISAGIKTNSKMTALTHFSVRRNKNTISNIIDPSEYQDLIKQNYAKQRTFECFDHLQFRLSQLQNMPKITNQIGRITKIITNNQQNYHQQIQINQMLYKKR